MLSFQDVTCVLVTFIVPQAVLRLVPVKVAANFDESPVAFNGKFTKHIVIKDSDTDLSFENRGCEDSKRMFTCVFFHCAPSAPDCSHCITGTCRVWQWPLTQERRLHSRNQL